MSNPSPDPEPAQPPSALRRFILLRQQHAKLFVEREHMVVNVKRNIIAGYQRKLGIHEHAFKKAEWEVARLKRELELVRDTADLDYDHIAGALEAEFHARELELNEASRQIERANQRLNTMMTMEQTAAFQARYRRLTEKLHPDLRFDQSVTAANIWQRAREAYAAGEAADLEALELLAEDVRPPDPGKIPPALLEEHVSRVKTASESTLNAIFTLRQEWPFPLAAKLPDESWIQSQREDYERKTATLLAERDVLTGELNRILDTRPAEQG